MNNIFNKLFGRSIKNRVMRVITNRIRIAQKKYDEQCKQIDKESEDRKDTYAMNLVEDVLGRSNSSN